MLAQYVEEPAQGERTRGFAFAVLAQMAMDEKIQQSVGEHD
jgi:hypothetical protein